MNSNIETTVTSDFEYIRLQYLIWRCNGLQSPNKVQANAGKALADIIGNGKKVPLIINCSQVTSLANYSFDPICEKIKDSKRTVCFLYSSEIEMELGKYLRNSNLDFDTKSVELYSKTYYKNNKEESDRIITNCTDNAIGLCKNATDDEIKRVKSHLSKCFIKKDGFERLKSTPILSNGAFNARKIISEPNAFMQTCLLLNEKISFIAENSRPKKPRIISVSLRASAFAGVIGQLNKMYVEIIDHIGPKYKLLENSKLSFDEQNFEYLFVGDFLIGGTEMKIANTYTHLKGSNIKDAIFLASLLPPQDYESDINIYTLIPENLNEINKTVEYKLFNG